MQIKNIRIAIVGSGALGGYYGARLARAGYDVHFLLRSDYKVVKQRGLIVHSCDGDFHLKQVNCYNNPADIGTVDLVFIGLKTTANSHYKELITPLMGTDTLAFTAQNGLGNDEQLAELFGAELVAGGLAFLCSNRTEPGIINHLDYGHIHVGSFRRKADDKVRWLCDAFNKSGVKCQLVDNLALAQWRKLIWNVPFNGQSALLDMTVDKIVSNPSLRQRSYALMKEIQSAARANNLHIPNEDVEQMMAYTDTMKPYYTSMHLDAKNKRPMEVESIIGEPYRRGTKAGAAMPLTKQLYEELIQLENTSQNKR